RGADGEERPEAFGILEQDSQDSNGVQNAKSPSSSCACSRAPPGARRGVVRASAWNLPHRPITRGVRMADDAHTDIHRSDRADDFASVRIPLTERRGHSSIFMILFGIVTA